MKRISLLSLLVAWIFLTMCTGKNKQQIADENKGSSGARTTSAIVTQNQDSIELTNLVRKMYKWHEASFKNKEDFPPAEKTMGDSLRRSIDWKAHNQAVEKLKASGFFNKNFIDTYQAIAAYIDGKLKDGTGKWRDGDLPPFAGYESDPWCNCQDYPTDNWDWNTITVKGITVANGKADFIWYGRADFIYKLSAKKENNLWKINSMEGFSVEKYLVQH